MKRRTGLLAVPAWLLAACATPVRERPSRFWSGRLSLHVQGDTPQDWHAAFELQGSPAQGQLDLLSPLGHVLVRLSWTPGHALLEQGEQRWSDTSVQALTERLTRTPVPVPALFDWLEGRATAAEGWTVDTSAWSEGRLQAQRSSPAPAARLRLVLDR
jgi:outer membrane lipoprotein LolB